MSTGRAPDAPAPAEPEAPPAAPERRAADGVRREVAAALADAGVVQELVRLSEAVEALGRRLDELVERVDGEAAPGDDGAGRVPLLHNLRSISTNRTGRHR